MPKNRFSILLIWCVLIISVVKTETVINKEKPILSTIMNKFQSNKNKDFRPLLESSKKLNSNSKV